MQFLTSPNQLQPIARPTPEGKYAQKESLAIAAADADDSRPTPPRAPEIARVATIMLL
jgi:hypothetical protein